MAFVYLCPMNASIYAFESPMQEIPYERKWKESDEKEKKTPKWIVLKNYTKD
jgi:hypothetical protein